MFPSTATAHSASGTKTGGGGSFAADAYTAWFRASLPSDSDSDSVSYLGCIVASKPCAKAIPAIDRLDRMHSRITSGINEISLNKRITRCGLHPLCRQTLTSSLKLIECQRAQLVWVSSPKTEICTFWSWVLGAISDAGYQSFAIVRFWPRLCENSLKLA